MILLCNVKLLSHIYFSRYRLLIVCLLFLDKSLCSLELFFIGTPDTRYVLRSIVWILSIDLIRVNNLEEAFKQLSECDLLRIIDDSHTLYVTCICIANLLIGWVHNMTLLVTTLSCDDSWG